MLTASRARPASLSLHNHILREQGRSARRQRNSDSNGPGVADQFEKVGPLNRVASCQYEDWNLQSRDLVDQLFTLIRAEFHRIAVRLGRCAAVHAGEIACLGHFPDGDERPFIEVSCVDLRVHEPISARESHECSDQSPRLCRIIGNDGIAVPLVSRRTNTKRRPGTRPKMTQVRDNAVEFPGDR